MQRKEWHFHQPSFELVRQLAVDLDISGTLATILVNRKIGSSEEAGRFLNPSLEELHDPFIMLGMEAAVRIISQAIAHGKKILIFGDYDVDGVTGTVVLLSYLQNFTDRVSYYIPHRVKEGYGLQADRIRRFAREGGGLIISVDCGISHFKEVTLGRDLGLPVIITDHHKPPPTLPPAEAILNPLQAGCPYPFKQLAGVGIAFKLVQAMALRFGLSREGANSGSRESVFDYLDLVALGTVADMVPLRNENRILVTHGLKRLNKPVRAGVEALKKVAGLKSRPLRTEQISFALGPRINAAGRLGRADTAVDLLLEERPERAAELAGTLNEKNYARQQIEARILNEAQELIRADPALLERNILVLTSPNWHSGVIGIVASKLSERYVRPSILISTQNNPGKGSARSVPRFDLHLILQQCRHLLDAFGGHSYAAGLSIHEDKIDALCRTLNGLEIPARELPSRQATIHIDASIGFGALRAPLLSELSLLMPFGHGNPAPTFASKNVYLSRPLNVGNNHLRLTLHQKPYRKEAIGFSMGDLAASLTPQFPFDIAFSLDFNRKPSGSCTRLQLCDIHLPYSLEHPGAIVKNP